MTTAAIQRSAVITRMARAIAFQRGRTWERMTAARQAQIRTEVIVALRAMKPAGPPDYDDCIAVGVADKVSPDGSVDAFAVARHVEVWVDEVLA